jgi:hypothetical protein
MGERRWNDGGADGGAEEVQEDAGGEQRQGDDRLKDELGDAEAAVAAKGEREEGGDDRAEDEKRPGVVGRCR